MRQDWPSDFAYAHAAWMVPCEEKALRAFAKVETGPLGAFDNAGDPTILYERHVFDRLTEGRYRSVTITLGGVSYKLSDPAAGYYGPTSIQKDKLAAAQKLDLAAARKSCSWGLYQIMGSHYVRCGYEGLGAFVEGMSESADEQLRALVGFLRSDSKLKKAIHDRNWAVAASIYNGPNYAVNKYDEKYEAAYLGA